MHDATRVSTSGAFDETADTFDALAGELEGRLRDPAWDAWTESDLSRWALAAFRLQFEACRPYRAFCERRGVTPDTVGSWEEIPAVPATAFKYFDFDSSGGAGGEGGRAAEGGRGFQSGRAVEGGRGFEDGRVVFRTSGTTRGADARGRHVVPRLELYRASLIEPFRRALVPDSRDLGDGLPFVSLVPSPEEAPDSSLSFMVGSAAERLAAETHWLVGADGTWIEEAVERAAERMDGARARGEPVLVLGTALAFVHLIGGVGSAVRAALADLPEGSRAMETGGFKGARREVSRDELYGGIERLAGIPRGRIVNEYGMTELLSQLYEQVLTEGAGAEGLHVPPPWLRVRALDPTTLRPMSEGEDGILAFFDLANLGSVCHVLTEDVGAIVEGRVRLRGRASGAEPRGCSRAMDDLMAAAGRREAAADG